MRKKEPEMFQKFQRHRLASSPVGAFVFCENNLEAIGIFRIFADGIDVSGRTRIIRIKRI